MTNRYPFNASSETHLTPARGVTTWSDAPCGHQVDHTPNGFPNKLNGLGMSLGNLVKGKGHYVGTYLA